MSKVLNKSYQYSVTGDGQGLCEMLGWFDSPEFSQYAWT